jgi:hypothetical protein
MFLAKASLIALVSGKSVLNDGQVVQYIVMKPQINIEE